MTVRLAAAVLTSRHPSRLRDLTINDPLLVAAIVALGLTAAAWTLAARLGRLEDRPLGTGLLSGILGAGMVGGAVVVLVTIAMNGREFLFSGPLSLSGAFTLGLFLGVPVAVAFLWLGAFLMPVGLLLGQGDRWLTVGAWVAVPIVAVALFALYNGYRSVVEAIEAPAIVSGSITFDVTGVQTARAMGDGAASCTFADDGGFWVDAEPVASDDRRVSVQIGWPVEEDPWIAFTIGERGSYPGKGQDAIGGTVSLTEGSTKMAGTLLLNEIVPLGPEGEPDLEDPWTGTVGWDCPSG